MGLPAHHVRGLFGRRTFTNPWSTWEERGFADLFRWWRERSAKGLPTDGWLTGNKRPTAADFQAAFPVAPTDWARLAAPPRDKIQMTWLGHASALVQMEGVTFLTDPVLALRCSPLSFAGPKRVVPPALDVFDPRCPKPDFVLISHSHYDHLCAASVAALRARFGGDEGTSNSSRPLHWYVPLGLAAWFRAAGVRHVTELDWWQEAAVAGKHGGSVRVACTPAQHWSQRTPWDSCATLWASWAVAGPRRRFWFAGDTGYCPVFAQIGAKYGPFDLSAIPVAAYEPRWFHRPAHLDPADAVQVHADVRSKASVAVHCATWALTDEALDEPPRQLAAAAAAAGLRPGAFRVMQHGATEATGGEEEAAAEAEAEAAEADDVAEEAQRSASA